MLGGVVSGLQLELWTGRGILVGELEGRKDVAILWIDQLVWSL